MMAVSYCSMMISPHLHSLFIKFFSLRTLRLCGYFFKRKPQRRKERKELSRWVDE
jgi:hypothetical protein